MDRTRAGSSLAQADLLPPTEQHGRRYYVGKLAEEGFVGVMLSQSPELVAPHGSSQALFGTNPLAVGCPQADGQPPLVVDLATSAVAQYDLIAAREAGRQVRPGSQLRPAPE